MDKLIKLKLDRIFKELDFLNSDYDYKNEFIQDSDREFIKEVKSTLDENPKLKEIYKKKEKEFNEKVAEKASKTDDLDKDILKNIKEGEDFEGDESQEPEEKEEEKEEKETSSEDTKKPNKIKKIYRSIVKITHPDKVKDDKLNQYYIEATDYYNDNNIYGLYIICNKLNIDYDIGEQELKMMEEQIKLIKNKINFIKKTFTWRWAEAVDDQKKPIILEFIKHKINSL